VCLEAWSVATGAKERMRAGRRVQCARRLKAEVAVGRSAASSSWAVNGPIQSCMSQQAAKLVGCQWPNAKLHEPASTASHHDMALACTACTCQQPAQLALQIHSHPHAPPPSTHTAHAQHLSKMLRKRLLRAPLELVVLVRCCGLVTLPPAPPLPGLSDTARGEGAHGRSREAG